MEFPGTVNFPGSKPTGRKESRSALRPSRCFVKTRCGAIVREGPGFGSAMVAELPHRVVVTAVGVMENANGARVRISAPVNGWVSFKNVELYPKTSPEPVDEAADPEDQAQIDDDRRAAEEAVALARLAEEEGGFSDTESFDSDASSYEVVEEIAGPDFVDAAKFSGFRAGYFFTTRDGATGYFRDPEEFVKHKRKVPDAVDGARGEPYRVVGLLGLKVRERPELHSKEVGTVPEGCEVRALETCSILVADAPTPGDPWAKAAHLYHDRAVTRAFVDESANDAAGNLKGWVTLSDTLLRHVELRLMVDKKRLRECLKRLERGGGVGDAGESRRALEDLANLVNENPALMVTRDLQPYVEMLRTLLKERAGVDEAARLRARDEADSDDDDGGDWIRSEQFLVKQAGAVKEAEALAKTGSFVAIDATPPLAETWSMVRGPTRAEKEGERDLSPAERNELVMAHGRALIEARPRDAPGAGVVAAVRIGDVAAAKVSPRDATRVPKPAAHRGAKPWLSPEVLEAFRWMMQKVELRQDMFLVSEPGPRARGLVAAFCDLLGREAEFVALTRDTCESDLKQRREIRDGALVWANQAPVEAALHGRVLVLEGVDKAERNVLPTLNNLIENREMALDDGTFLTSPERFDALARERAAAGATTEADAAAALEAEGLRRASQAFVVVAIGVPVPKFAGNPLDPPLRSRFSCFDLKREGIATRLATLVNVGTAQDPADPTAVRQLARLADALDGARDADADAAAERAGGRDAKAAAATVYARAAAPFFPATAASSVCLLGTLFPRMPVHAELARAYPHGLLFAPSSADRRLVDAAYQALGLKQTRLDARGLPVLDGLDGDALYRFATSASLDAGDGERRVVLRFETPSNSAEPPSMTQHGVFGGRDAPRKFAVDLTVKQQVVLSAMLRDHCAGIDVCLCGWRGVGKTALARCFADALGYRVRTIFCYKDMGARDFLQRRVTDDRGNTGWKDSALVDAALRGDVAVLDGVDRLPRGLLYATLARLVSDRELDLPDGTRLCAPRRWAELLRGGLSETDLRARGLRRVSPSFRVVAIAGSVPSGTRDDRRGQWLDPELASLFHFHVAPVFEPNDERKLMKRELGPAPDGDVVVDVLLSYNKSIRDHAYQRDKLAMEKKVAAPATSLALCALSLRQLLRAARTAALDHDPDDCIDKAVGAYAKYLDPADRDAVQRYANTACRQAGLPCVEGSVAINGARSAPGKDRQLALLAKRAGRAAPAPDYAERRRVEHLVLGDVAAPTRAPARPELVPDPLFVPIHSHMWLLRDALLDWRAGHHLLFIGNQGVGKNKIADKLLHLLRCEREYVQLHRDTTVGSLTSAPVLSDGVVSRGDSPLVRALRHGRCLVVDEADKAPLEVVCILKALVEDGDLQLADGRRCLRRSLGGHAAEADDDTLWIDDAFRMIVLANRPGRPFQGNDFYRECGDAFASFGVDNPEVRSEVAMLKAYAPAVPDALVTKLSTTFGKLRDLAESSQAWEQRDEARLAYPYSARELVKVCEHLNAFADDGVDAALADVFAFDAHVPPLKVTLDNALKQDGFVMCGAMREDDDENFAADEKRALRKRREAGVDLTKLALDVDESAVVVADARGGSVAAAKRRGDAALVPFSPGRRGARAYSPDDREGSPMPKTWIAALRWMMQKLALKHDMFLIGDPGPRPRALVLQFCELLGRECEFVALTRDTSEGDLKQRREIRDGALVWANQPPVLAALHGRVLVLSGVERAERNVLPLLNNLLENREMALDDGTFLMDAKRFDALCAEDAERASGLVDGEEGWADAVKAARRRLEDVRGLRRAHEDFIVVAIGVAVPKHAGNPLDPPLRSRFSAYTLGPPSRVELEKAALAAVERVYARALPAAPPLAHRRAVLDKTKKLCAMVSALRRLWEPSLRKTARMRSNAAAAKSGGEVHVPDWRADQVMREQPTAARPWAPDGAVESTAALLAAFPRLPPGAALKRAYCYDLLESLKLDADGRAELDAWLDDAGFDVVEAEDPRGSTPFGPTPRLAGKVAAPAGERVPRETPKPKQASAEAPEFAAPRTDGAPAAEPAPNLARAALARRLRGDSDSDSDSDFEYDADGRRVRVRYDADGRRLDDGAASESDESLDADGRPVGRGDDDSDDDDASLDADGVAVAKPAPSAAVLAARAKLLRVSGDADAGVNVAAEDASSDSETSSLAGLELDYVRVDGGDAAPADGAAPAPLRVSPAAYLLAGVEAHADDPDSGARRRLLSFRTADGDEVRAVAVAGAGAESLSSAPSILSGSQRRVLGAMVQDHVVGVDLCVVGERGVGKTLVIRDFAAALGYRCRTVFCYKDMGARDLTMRRVTDARGNTEWRRSPLIEAALDGGLAVLDGAHRLAPGVLRSTLGRLLSDREIQLPDGTRLVSPAAYAALREMYEEAELTAKGVLRAHPAFRVVCAGEPPSAHNPWISAELAGLMHYHALAPLSSAEQTSLVRHALEAGGAGAPRALAAGEERALLDYGDALRRAVATESILEPLLLTARRLAQIGAHLRSRPQDGVEDAVDHIFAAYQDFLPAPKRATARRMLRDALVTRGVPTAKERGGASFGRRVSRKRDRAASARCHVAPCVTFGAGSTFYLGDAAGEKRSPRRRDLVPRPPFVEMAAHMWALRDMLVDWSLGRHLLLIGNQGVGKNKLADRLLQLLDAEREYVQLHRDTTVQALTASPTLKGGVVVWEDSPLVKAARHGRCLVVDEADKAPLEVVCVLKALVDDGELQLADGRRLARPAATGDAGADAAADAAARAAGDVPVAPGFRLVVLANRPGFPFLGNDFYRECGDAFACHAVENADEASEVQMLRRYGPGVRVKQVVKLTQAFKKLRAMYDDGAISYPYSSRELVKLVQHLDRFPADGLRGAVADVFGFDAQDPQLHAKLMSVLDAVEESHHEAEAEKPPPPPKAKDDVADKNTKDGEEGPNTRVEYTDKPDGDGASAKTPEGAEGRDAGREAKREAQGTAKATQDGVVSEAPTDRDADPSPAPPPRDRRGAAPGGSDSTKTPAGEGSGEAKAAEAQALGFKDGSAAAGGAEDVEAKDDAGAPASTEPRGRATADPGGAARIKDERPVASAGETSEERAQREKVTSALGAEDRRKTLHQLQMTEKDARQYEKLYAAVESQVGVLRAALLGREARERERTWKRLQTHGELDELMLVDGITGATNIYKRRSPDDAARLLSQQLPKRIKFVLDISGSMYTYNRLDGRLTRVLQALIMLMEALDGFEHKYEYSVVGHSGAASAVLLVPWASPPKTRLERLKLVRKMVNHAQTCKSGDHTLQATKRAVADVAAKAADEYFVFLLSDADFGRYDLTGRDLGAALTADPRVSAYALFIASNFEAAEAIKDELPPGKGFSCYDTSKLIGTLRDIFQASIVFSKHSAH